MSVERRLENKEEFENVVIQCLNEDLGLDFIDDNFWKRPVGHCHGHVWWVSYAGMLGVVYLIFKRNMH